MAVNNVITYSGIDPATERPFSVRGTGNTRAEALAEANAKLAMTVLTVQKATESLALAAGDAGTPASGVFADAYITLGKGIGYSDKVVRLKNVTTAIKKAGTKGHIDGANALVAAFVAAYVDGDGTGGWTFIDGMFEE